MSIDTKEHVIFSISHIASLSTAIALRHTKYRNDSCILLIVCTNPKEYNINLMKNKVFDNVITLPELCGVSNINEKFIIDYLDDFFKLHKINLTNAKECISCADLSDFFSLYCCIKNIKYSAFELYEGQFLEEERYNNFKWNDNLKYLQIKYDSLLNRSGICNKRYIFKKSSNSLIIDEEIDFYELLSLIPLEVKKRVVQSYEIEEYEFKNLLLLTGRPYTKTITKLNINDPFFVYRILLDLTVDDEEVIVKPHPGVCNDDIEKLFPHATILNSKIPIEFLTFKDEIKIEKVITGSISSFIKIQNIIEKYVLIELENLKNHCKIIKLYTLCSLFKELELRNIYTTFKIPTCVLDFFFNHSLEFNGLEYYQNSIYDIDIIKIDDSQITLISDIVSTDNNILLEKLINSPRNSIVCFIPNENFENYSKDLIDEILRFSIPIEIDKEILNKDLYCNPNKEVIYIYCKNIEMLNVVKTFSMEKYFKHTAINLHAKAVISNDMNLYYENVVLQSKQVELNNKVKTLEQSLVQTQKQNDAIKNELIKVIKKSNALEKFAVDSKSVIEMYKQEFIKVNNRLNELEK